MTDPLFIRCDKCSTSSGVLGVWTSTVRLGEGACADCTGTVVDPMSLGSRDGVGSGDKDTPYAWGSTPRFLAPYPFTQREYIKLTVLKGKAGVDRLPNADGVRRRRGEAADIELMGTSEGEPLDS